MAARFGEPLDPLALRKSLGVEAFERLDPGLTVTSYVITSSVTQLKGGRRGFQGTERLDFLAFATRTFLTR